MADEGSSAEEEESLNDGVVSQFALTAESLKNMERLPTWDVPLRVKRGIKRSYATNRKIGALRAGMRGVTVTATVREIPPRKPVLTRWGTQARVSNVLIADATGAIRIGLWNQQIDQVHVGETFTFTKCDVITFSDTLWLRPRKQSTISVRNQLQQEEVLQQMGVLSFRKLGGDSN